MKELQEHFPKQKIRSSSGRYVVLRVCGRRRIDLRVTQRCAQDLRRRGRARGHVVS